MKFVEVQMRTDWITESDPQIGPTTPTNDRYVRHDNYHYILELDRDNKIIGGEWVGESNLTHPDFIWTPTGQPHGNPHISLAEVRKLIEISRQDSQAVTPTPPGTGNNSCGAKTQPACNHGGGEWDLHCNPGCNPGSDKRCWGSCAMGSSTTPIRPTNVPTNNALTLRNNIRVAIPDGNPAGIRSVINSDDGGLIKSVKLSLNIQHQYRGDLVVQLRHGSAVVTIFDGQNDANPWSNDLIISNQAVEGFLSTPVAGQWELIVTDYGDLDTGSIIDWKLNVQTR